jgi:hypothetical protein
MVSSVSEEPAASIFRIAWSNRFFQNVSNHLCNYSVITMTTRIQIFKTLHLFILHSLLSVNRELGSPATIVQVNTAVCHKDNKGYTPSQELLHTWGPPTAFSSCWQCSVVLESCHMGESANENAPLNWSCKNLFGCNDWSFWRAPFCQYTEPCCCRKQMHKHVNNLILANPLH